MPMLNVQRLAILREVVTRGSFSGAANALSYTQSSVSQAVAKLEAETGLKLLEHGARLIGAPDLPRHVVFHPSTGEGLLELAAREHADVVVFGSDYRTAAGAVIPQASAQRLLNGGPVAVAIAPADLRSRSSVSVARVGVLAEGDDAPEVTARSLAAALGASVTERDDEPVDLLVVGSREGTPTGRAELSATASYAVDTSTAPVLVVPRGTPVIFPAPALAESRA